MARLVTAIVLAVAGSAAAQLGMRGSAVDPALSSEGKVTLARLRESSSRQVADYLAGRGLFRSPPFAVDRFVLFSSRASVGGGPYVVEAAFPRDAEGVVVGADSLHHLVGVAEPRHLSGGHRAVGRSIGEPLVVQVVEEPGRPPALDGLGIEPVIGRVAADPRLHQ